LLCLDVRWQIYEPEREINDVYFPLGCVLTVVTTMKDGGARSILNDR